jgi:hydroxyethylthiazole kinase-like sugar kinase family protein
MNKKTLQLIVSIENAVDYINRKAADVTFADDDILLPAVIAAAGDLTAAIASLTTKTTAATEAAAVRLQGGTPP